MAEASGGADYSQAQVDMVVEIVLGQIERELWPVVSSIGGGVGRNLSSLSVALDFSSILTAHSLLGVFCSTNV